MDNAGTQIGVCLIIFMVGALGAVILLGSEKRESETARKLYGMMERIDKTCRKHRIKYWIDGGTFLGAVREQKIIPWDDDIDIAMPTGDLLKFIRVGRKAGLMIVKNDDIWRVEIPGSDLYIDVFEVGIDSTGKYVYAEPSVRKRWPRVYWRPDEVEPLQEYMFGKLKLFGPNSYERYLTDVYGNWRVPVWQKPHHSEV